MLLFTLGYYNEIEAFFKDLTAIDQEPEQTQTLGTESKETLPSKPINIVVPKFLTKSSSTYYRRATDVEIDEVKQKRKKRREREREKARLKAKQFEKNMERGSRHGHQKSADLSNLVREVVAAGNSENSPMKVTRNTKNNFLNTIAETEQDKEANITDIDRQGRLAKRQDKGKDFFSSLANRTGVLGIVPSVVRRFGFKKDNKKKGYEEQRDDEEVGKVPAVNLSYDAANIMNLSGLNSGSDSRRKEGRGGVPIEHLKALARGEIDGKQLKGLEEKLRNVKKGMERMEKYKKDRMVQSMYVKPEGERGQLNLSGEIEPNSLESSMVEDDNKVKSGENSVSQQCLICFDKAPDAVFMECGHGGICYECAVEIWKATGECYLCRNQIIQVLQVDLKSKGDVMKVLTSTQMKGNWDD